MKERITINFFSYVHNKITKQKIFEIKKIMYYENNILL